MRGRLDRLLLRGSRPTQQTGVLVVLASVAVGTGLIYPLKELMTVSSLGVIYLLGVVVVSACWGLRLGVAMSMLLASSDHSRR